MLNLFIKPVQFGLVFFKPRRYLKENQLPSQKEFVFCQAELFNFNHDNYPSNIPFKSAGE